MVSTRQSHKTWDNLLGRWRESAVTKRYTYGGEPVSSRDCCLLQSVIVFAGATYVDLSSTKSFVAGPGFDAWLNSFEEFDAREFGTLTKKVDEALKALCNVPERSWVGTLSYRRFKRDVGYPSVHWRYMSCMKSVFERFFAHGDSKAFAILNTWINVTRRVNLDVDLVEDCEREYVDFENALKSQEYDKELIDELRDIVTDWFTGFDLAAGFKPCHGPGSVSGRTGRLAPPDKHLIMATDPSLQYLEKYIGPLTDYAPFGMQPGLKRESELVCVPKSMISNRTISREPASLQYFQQGVRNAMLSFINDKPALRAHIRLDDQESSRSLCREGSICGDYATVDLSSASDSNTKTLVYRVFSGCKSLQFALCCTRSRTTLLRDGTPVNMEKFAPMGSATCFVAMSVILAAVCKLAISRTIRKYRDSGERQPSISRKYLVYGDDIIVDTLVWDELRSILTQLHFVVNTTKSYYVPAPVANFREACGAEYMDGMDVAPMRIPRFFRGALGYQSAAGVAVASYVSFANNAFEKRMMCLRYAILKELRDVVPLSKYLLYDTTGDYGVRTSEDSCTNYHVKTRRGAYQTTQFHCVVLCATKDCRACKRNALQVGRSCRCPLRNNSARWDDVRYFEAMLQAVSRDDVSTYDYNMGIVDLRPHSYCRTRLRLAWRWVNDPSQIG